MQHPPVKRTWAIRTGFCRMVWTDNDTSPRAKNRALNAQRSAGLVHVLRSPFSIESAHIRGGQADRVHAASRGSNGAAFNDGRGVPRAVRHNGVMAMEHKAME